MFQSTQIVVGLRKWSIRNIKNKRAVLYRTKGDYQLLLQQKRFGQIIDLIAMIASIVSLTIKEIEANKWR